MESDDQFALFIGGLPKGFDLEELKTYFEGFGKIKRIEQPFTTTKKSFLKLQLESQAACDAILLNQYGHRYKGRDLIVKPYETGQRLREHNEELNHRRIVAKNVPRYVEESQIQVWLQEIAGPIVKMYSYENSSSGASKKKAKKKAYSILFQKRESADLIADLGSWQFPEGSQKIKFERFVAKKASKKCFQNIPKSEGVKNISCRRPLDSTSADKLEKSKGCTFADRHLFKPTQAKYHSLKPSAKGGEVGDGGLLFRLLKPQ